MLLDLLRTDNYVSFNKHLAHIIGLEQSIYVNQIINIMGKAIKKNKVINNGFVELDRNYIYGQTTFDTNKQLELDESLVKINLLIKDINNPNLLKIDTQLLANITTNDDMQLNNKISTIVSKPQKISRETKNYYVVENLSKYINTGEINLDNKIKEWLTVCVNKFGNANQTLIKVFQQNIYDYAKGDINVALKLVEIATAFGYKDCQWAIKKYEENLSTTTNDYKSLNTANENMLSKKQF